MPSIDLDFFGVGTRIVVPDPFDEQHFRYYFGDFAAEISEPPAIELHFVTRPERSFVQSLMSKSTLKVTMLREAGGPWRVHDLFTDRSTQPSPLPPFKLAAFQARFTTVHAASVVHPQTGGAALLSGPSFSGKSVMTLELLREGWGFLSDDMSIVEREGLALWAFPRPIGIRENTRKLLPWIDERVEGLGEARRIKTPSGETLMIRVDDLFPGARREQAPLRYFIELERRDDVDDISWAPLEPEHTERRLRELLGPNVSSPAEVLGRRVTYNLERNATELARALDIMIKETS